MILIQSLTFSQKSTLIKMYHNGEPGFWGNEMAMDTIMGTHYRLVDVNTMLGMTILELEKSNLNAQRLEGDTDHLEQQKVELQKQLLIKDKQHQTEILYCREKQKNKFKSGAVVGGGAVMVLCVVLAFAFGG